jgi:hypothetical protein
MVIDMIVKRERRRLGGEDPPPEIRLKAIWTGEILIPVSLLSQDTKYTVLIKTGWIVDLRILHSI